MKIWQYISFSLLAFIFFFSVSAISIAQTGNDFKILETPKVTIKELADPVLNSKVNKKIASTSLDFDSALIDSLADDRNAQILKRLDRIIQLLTALNNKR